MKKPKKPSKKSKPRTDIHPRKTKEAVKKLHRKMRLFTALFFVAILLKILRQKGTLPLTPGKVHFSLGGVFLSTVMNLLLSVKMMKYCGFNGIQVTDMCSTWAQYGGYEFVQQRIRFMADAAHSLDMKFTLWVWGSEFTGYGWTDDSVVYNGDGMWARENPKVQASFDKYYDIYARLADCSDRVIMHFNDPGNLSDSSDIGYYAARFKEKCIEKNPDIDFGVSCYTYQIDLGALKEYIDGNFTVYSGTSKSDADFEAVGKFREYAKNNELAMGVWSWNLCEMEIDQLAEMNVNAKIIADVYGRNSLLDDRYKPEYWSEMDSYHMVNLFSLYCAGQMLNSPDKNPDEVLMEICDG